MTETEKTDNADSERYRTQPEACPLCGTAMPEPTHAGKADDGDGVSRCPGCGEEYPNSFLREEFMSDVTAKFRVEGKGELGPLESTSAPGVEQRPLQKAVGITLPQSGQGAVDRDLKPGEVLTGGIAPSGELNPKESGLPGDEVHMARRPAPGEGSLVAARTPDRPTGPAMVAAAPGPAPGPETDFPAGDDEGRPRKPASHPGRQ